MPTYAGKILYLPHARLRRARRKPPPLTAEQARDRIQRQKARTADIEDAVAEWKANTLTIASDLARRFKKKPRYFLDLFFQGGVRLLRKQTKANSHNAFLYFKAEELRDKGINPTLHELHTPEIKEEYKNLTSLDLEEVVARYNDCRVDRVSQNRVTVSAKARVHDAYATLDRIRHLLDGLNTRVGVEGFFCVVRSNPTYHMEPQWHFTSSALREYMPMALPVGRPWDMTYIGTKVEAFAVAGCDTTNLNRTSKQKADAMKMEIRERINKKLGKFDSMNITGDAKASMQYSKYEELVVQKYGVELVGWTYPNGIVNPSTLSTALGPLRTLLDALNSDACKFVKLSTSQLRERREKLTKDIEDGVVIVKARKPRNDRGVKRTRQGNSKKKSKASSNEVVDGNDDIDDDNEEEEEEPEEASGGCPEPPRKRATTSKASRG